jgi:hypothetical protein
MRKRPSCPLECEALEDRVTPATLAWTGTVDGLWSHAGNWSTSDVTHPVPQNGDAVVLPAGAVNRTQSDDLSLSLASLTFLDVGYSISGQQITLGNLSVTLSSPATGSDLIANDLAFVVTAPSDTATMDLGQGNEVLTLSGNVVVAGAGTLSVVNNGVFASTSALSISGTLTVQASATMDLQRDLTLLGTTAVYGTLHVGRRVDIATGATLVDAGAVDVFGQLYIAGLLDVAQSQNGAELTAGFNGLVVVESGGELFAAGRVNVLNGELYDAGLTLIAASGELFQQKGDAGSALAATVVAPGGQLYSAGLVYSVQYARLFVFGQMQVAAGSGLYVYDGELTVEAGGSLYAYGTVAIEPDTAFYDYGIFVLAHGGYLYDAGLFVVEQGGVFYDSGTFVAPGGIYYNFGQQVGYGG